MIRYVYVSGPLTIGDQAVNVRQAILAAEVLRGAGLAPFVPHLTWLAHIVSPAPYETWMTDDFAWLEKCDALLRLPGESSGADRELALAMKLGLPVFEGDAFSFLNWLEFELPAASA